MTEKPMRKGRLVVPSADALGLVKLLPGEVAVLKLPANHPVHKTARDVLNGKKALQVTYEVSEFWGKRFGIWHGKLTGSASAPAAKAQR